MTVGLDVCGSRMKKPPRPLKAGDPVAAVIQRDGEYEHFRGVFEAHSTEGRVIARFAAIGRCRLYSEYVTLDGGVHAENR